MPSLLSQRQQRQSTVGTQSQLSQFDLPPYEPPKYPLSRDAQAKLDALLKGKHDTLKTHFQDASNYLADAASDVNKVLRIREAKSKRKRDRSTTGDGDDDDVDAENEEDIERLRTTVDGRTRDMDLQLRKLIDGRQTLEHMEESIQRVRARAMQQGSQTAARRSQAPSQTRGRRRRDENDQGDDSDPDPTLPGSVAPTAASEAQEPVPSLHETYGSEIEAKAAKYKALSHSARYAEHNVYVAFRKTVYDALYEDGEVPNARSWFADDKTINLTSSDLLARGADEGDEDADFAVSRVKESLKCPLTLLPFEDPVTSAVCKHSFEKETVLSMIRQSFGPPRINGNPHATQRRWQPGEAKWMLCPKPGCQKEIHEHDLKEDRYLQQKTKSLLRKDLDDSGSEDEEGEAQSVDGDQDGFQSIDEDEDE